MIRNEVFGTLLGVTVLLLGKAQVTVSQFEERFDCLSEETFTPDDVFAKVVNENLFLEVDAFFCAGIGMSGSFPIELPDMPKLIIL